MKKFNIHTDIMPEEKADWVSNGDIWQAEYLGFQLMIFLESIAVNPNAIEAMKSLNIPWIGIDNARLIVDALRRPKSKENGKSAKSGAELFGKFLVPNKPTKKQFEAIYLALIVANNMSGNNKAEFKRICNEINAAIENNNEVLKNWDKGTFDKHFYNYNQFLPKRRITVDQLEKDYRKFKPKIDTAHHKIK